MKKREEWRPVLDAEVERWSAKSSAQLIEELADVQGYETEFENKMYQVEVEIRENTEKYVHVSVAVDDGGWLGSFSPLSTSFICEKE